MLKKRRRKCEELWRRIEMRADGCLSEAMLGDADLYATFVEP
jgi:hypothetical protein